MTASTPAGLGLPTSAFTLRFALPRSPALLALPLLAFFGAFVCAPIVALLLASFSDSHIGGGLTAANLMRFFSDGISLPIVIGTLRLSCESALLALVLGYPIALVFVSAPRWLQRLLLIAIILPLLTSAVVRTFAWVVILGRQGPVNAALMALGLSDRPAALLYTEPALVLAMAQVELPLMALPLISALAGIDPRLGEASVSLGAGPWATLWRIILPLSAPGAVAGLVLVFASACSALITQSIIGGGRLIFAPLYIYQQGMQAQDWPFAATLSLALLASVLCVVGGIGWLGRRIEAGSHG